MTKQTISAQDALTQTSVTESYARGTHLLYIDNIRTMLITCVILLHVAVTYGAVGDWYYYEAGETSTVAFIVMTFLGAIGAAFVLGLFFMLAGYFTPHSYDRKGFWGFLVDRMKRLLIPLAFYEVVINPFINYAVDIHKQPQAPIWQYLIDHFRGLESIADGPVWFLLALMVFSIFYALWRRVVGSSFEKQGNNDMADKLPSNGAIAWFAVVLGFTTFIVRIWAPIGKIFEPWNQELAHYPQYIFMFAVGTLAYRSNWLTKFPASQIRLWSWVALACVLTLPLIVIAAGALTGELDERGAGGWNWISFSYSVWEGFVCPAFSIVTLAWFRKRFDRQGWLTKKMADATFTAYVLHPGVIVPLVLLLSGVSINMGLKFVLVAPIAVALTYLISYYFRRLPLVRNVF